MSKLQHISYEGIVQIVDTFYFAIRKDPDLAPIFEKSIGTTNEAWQPHLERMYSFWSSMMLGSGTYSGNPLQKHMELPAFDEALFGRWLELFTIAARQVFEENVAAEFILRGQRIAGVFKSHMYR